MQERRAFASPNMARATLGALSFAASAYLASRHHGGRMAPAKAPGGEISRRPAAQSAGIRIE
jgi:hypothetical protein